MFNNLNQHNMKLFNAALIVLMLGLTSFSTTAQETPEPKTTFSLEIDPVTFIQRGYSAHLRIKPKSSEHFLLGVGAYAMNMPEAIVNFNSNNRDMGWKLRLNQGYGLFGEYYFSETNRKFFVGSQAGIQQYKIENATLTGSETFSSMLLMGYGGYALQPFQFPLYFKFWGGVGYTSKVAGTNVLQDSEYDLSPITVFATLHIGYTINK